MDDRAKRVVARELVANISYLRNDINRRLDKLETFAAALAREVLPVTDSCHPDWGRPKDWSKQMELKGLTP